MEQAKKALGIESFRNLTAEKVVEFMSLIPNMDKDVAMEIIKQFPSYVEMATNMVEKLKEMSEAAMDKASESQKETIAAYKTVLLSLEELLKKEDLSFEERKEINEQMILVADKIAAKDKEYKNFLLDAMKTVTPFIGGALVLGAAILGVSAKGIQLPTIKK